MADPRPVPSLTVLPSEIVLLIFSYLSCRTLLFTASLASKRWRELATRHIDTWTIHQRRTAQQVLQVLPSLTSLRTSPASLVGLPLGRQLRVLSLEEPFCIDACDVVPFAHLTSLTALDAPHPRRHTCTLVDSLLGASRTSLTSLTAFDDALSRFHFPALVAFRGVGISSAAGVAHHADQLTSLTSLALYAPIALPRLRELGLHSGNDQSTIVPQMIAACTALTALRLERCVVRVLPSLAPVAAPVLRHAYLVTDGHAAPDAPDVAAALGLCTRLTSLGFDRLLPPDVADALCAAPHILHRLAALEANVECAAHLALLQHCTGLRSLRLHVWFECDAFGHGATASVRLTHLRALTCRVFRQPVRPAVQAVLALAASAPELETLQLRVDPAEGDGEAAEEALREAREACRGRRALSAVLRVIGKDRDGAL